MRALYISVSVIMVDQATKLLVKGFSLPMLNFSHRGMELGASVPILGDALRLTHIENPGMAFGIELGSGLYLALFSILASVGIFYYLYSVRDRAFIVRVSLALILGGAIGNLIDRVFYGVLFGDRPLFHGRVVDFVDVNIFRLSRFGIFNVADAAVTAGVIMLLLFHRHLDIVNVPLRGSAESSREQPPGETPDRRERSLVRQQSNWTPS